MVTLPTFSGLRLAAMLSVLAVVAGCSSSTDRWEQARDAYCRKAHGMRTDIRGELENLEERVRGLESSSASALATACHAAAQRLIDVGGRLAGFKQLPEALALALPPEQSSAQAGLVLNDPDEPLRRRWDEMLVPCLSGRLEEAASAMADLHAQTDQRLGAMVDGCDSLAGR